MNGHSTRESARWIKLAAHLGTRKCIPMFIFRGKKKNRWEKEGRDWKEIKGRRAGNRRRGGKERRVSFSRVGRRNSGWEIYRGRAESRKDSRRVKNSGEERKLGRRGNYEWWIDGGKVWEKGEAISRVNRKGTGIRTKVKKVIWFAKLSMELIDNNSFKM